MSLNLYLRSSAAGIEQRGPMQRVAAILGLAGLVVAWAVLLLPCALWMLGSLIVNRAQGRHA